MEILTEYGLEIFFGLVSAGLLAYCKYLWAQKQELAKRKEEDLTRLHRQMILDEIEPITAELVRIKSELNNNINTLRSEADQTHANMYKDLELVTKKNDKSQRIIVLCPLHTSINRLIQSSIQTLAITKNDKANTIFIKAIHFISHRLDHQAHKSSDFRARTIPILF